MLYGIDRTCATEAGSRKADDTADPLWTQDRETPRSYHLVRCGWRQALHGTANVNRQWVRNVQKTPKIKLSMGDESFSGTVRFLTDRAEHERVMTAIRRKYWMFRPIMELGRILSAKGLMRDNAGSFEVTLLGLG